MNKIRVSILTPSIRMDGLNILQKGLEKQTFPADSFEWLTELGLLSQGHSLNKAYNRMLRRAKGELVISLQDYCLIRPDYLQKWWDAYQANPNTFMTAPVGKVNDLNYSSKPVWDWRAYRNDEHENVRICEWDCWEIDNGAAPLEALKQIGGFDETLDGHWSADNVNVGCRALLAGYEFKCVFDNPVLAYDHDAHMPHPFRASFDGTFNTKRMAMFRGGMTLSPLH